MNKSTYEVLCYTRKPQEEQLYAPKLAYSMHLACSLNGAPYRPLNHNSGVLFAKATERENGTLCAKSLRNPYLFAMADGKYGVVAIRTEAGGEPDTESWGSVLLFVSPDLLQYNELGLLRLGSAGHIRDVRCEYEPASARYVIDWVDDDGNAYRSTCADIASLDELSPPEPLQSFALPPIAADIEGFVPRNVMSVPPQIGERLVRKLTVPIHVRTEAPQRIEAAGGTEQLQAVGATVVYSDGTTASKRVDWDTSGIDWERPGTYRATGRIRQERFPFPAAAHRADPCIAKWNGRYYFIATNDADGNRSLSIRSAESIPDLVTAEEIRLLDTDSYDILKNFLWAPEFHEIDGQLYLFFAGSTGEFIHIQSHVMRLKKGGDPVVAADWETPVRVVRQDGSPLFEHGITLDMTILQWNGRVYALWAQRQLIPHDLGSWIYIAEVDGGKPWRLKSEPVWISRPDYGWTNNRTFVEEGPFALITDRKIFVTFAAAMVDATYCVGLLSAEPDADLLDPASWTKGNYPLLTSRHVPGEYGPGHNSYVTDDDGVIWNVYHARSGIDEPRCTGLRRVHFDIDGCPMLDLTPDRDVNPALAELSLDVVVMQRRG
ncbi:glycosyl hydrolase [Paenibacillus nanensis]|uniref:Glycosyl hydrolase n=1 Tax=Paenibacillus nanensis TaxID=393251 RepID=A0A3A1UMZ6_9BACL|nr:family 43 glycosylhydrolase [Paenibacillus nanensis]RIX46560.1 glycosyl hydrolase [Paenibacillus nanensis]